MVGNSRRYPTGDVGCHTTRRDERFLAAQEGVLLQGPAAWFGDAWAAQSYGENHAEVFFFGVLEKYNTKSHKFTCRFEGDPKQYPATWDKIFEFVVRSSMQWNSPPRHKSTRVTRSSIFVDSIPFVGESSHARGLEMLNLGIDDAHDAVELALDWTEFAKGPVLDDTLDADLNFVGVVPPEWQSGDRMEQEPLDTFWSLPAFNGLVGLDLGHTPRMRQVLWAASPLFVIVCGRYAASFFLVSSQPSFLCPQPAGFFLTSSQPCDSMRQVCCKFLFGGQPALFFVIVAGCFFAYKQVCGQFYGSRVSYWWTTMYLFVLATGLLLLTGKRLMTSMRQVLWAISPLFLRLMWASRKEMAISTMVSSTGAEMAKSTAMVSSTVKGLIAATFGLMMPSSITWRLRSALLGSIIGVRFGIPLGLLHSTIDERAKEMAVELEEKNKFLKKLGLHAWNLICYEGS
ncbi:hypothetical protein L7F22_000968 [Adiantum nelumboides]|nr:hypothetical protein [Adiantum nelumboides]